MSRRGCNTATIAASTRRRRRLPPLWAATKQVSLVVAKNRNCSSKKSSWFQQKCVDADSCIRNNLAGSSNYFAGCSKIKRRCQQNDSTVVPFQHRSCVDVAFFSPFPAKALAVCSTGGRRLHRRQLLVAAFRRSGSSKKTHPLQHRMPPSPSPASAGCHRR